MRIFHSYTFVTYSPYTAFQFSALGESSRSRVAACNFTSILSSQVRRSRQAIFRLLVRALLRVVVKKEKK